MAKKKTFNNPDSQEREYTRLLVRYSKQLQANVEQVLIPRLANIKLEFDVERRADSWVDTLDTLIAELARLAMEAVGVVIQKLPGQFNAISKFNEGQFKMVVKANTGLELPPVMPGAPSSAILGVNVFRSEPFLKPLAEGWVRENTSLIKTLPTRLHPELEGIIRRGVMDGASVKEMRDMIRARYGVSNYRATLIAQDQTLKANAALTRYRLQSVGVRRYTWRSVGDSRVRPEHAYLNGKEFSFDEPPAEGNPGTPVRCRCRAEAVWDGDGEIQPSVEVMNFGKGNPGKEMAIITDPKTGKEIFRKIGRENAVDFTRRDLSKMKGAILTHNHPDEMSLSLEDFKSAGITKLKEVIAVSPSGTEYRGQFIKLIPTDLRDSLLRAARPLAQKALDAGLGKAEIMQLVSHVQNIAYAERGLVKYRVVPSSVFKALLNNNEEFVNALRQELRRAVA